LDGWPKCGPILSDIFGGSGKKGRSMQGEMRRTLRSHRAFGPLGGLHKKPRSGAGLSLEIWLAV